MRTARWVATIGLMGCGGGELVTLRVDHYQTPCLSVELQLCLRVRESDNDDWQRFFDTIEGYEPIWGALRTVEVYRRVQIGAAEGAEDYNWTFGQITEESFVPPGTTFVYPFRPNEQSPDNPAVTVSDTGGVLMDGKPYTCAADTCAELQSWMGSNASVVMTLEYGDPVTDALTLTQVTASQGTNE